MIIAIIYIVYMIKDNQLTSTLNYTNNPRQRLYLNGPKSLSDAELLAIVLRTGGKTENVLDLSTKLLAYTGGLKGFFTKSLAEFLQYKNLGLAKSSTLIALCELSLRLTTNIEESVQLINKPLDVYEVLRNDLYAKKKEHLYLLSLDTRRRVIGKDIISIGTLDESLIHPREVYRPAIVRNAYCVVLAHNHPSNNCDPSKEDIEITQKIFDAGKILGIRLLDHIVITDNDFCSIFSKTDLNTYKGGDKK